jgi:O-acetyl-ADP-ribose deacetylase (regulator of RNase III)
MKDLPARIAIVKGDITRQKVDAVVNAANHSLLGGGGVDGAIHDAAGPDLLKECRTLNGCATGAAKITRGYRLPAKWVIHTVGPIWSGGGHQEAELLAECYRSSLQIAQQHLAVTIAFPSISTGAFGYPVEQACGIALREIMGFLDKHDLPEKVLVICFDPYTYHQYTRALAEHLPRIVRERRSPSDE